MGKTKKAYTYLAQFYDRLMDVDYQHWVEYLCQTWDKFNVKPQTILELGCGTGNITLPLAQMGYEITALDNSPQMVELARQKCSDNDLDVEFIVGKMEEFDLDRQFDVIICCCDALNYLTSTEDIVNFMLRSYQHTKAGGLLLFDLNSELKLREIYGDQSYAEIFADFGFYWDNTFDEVKEICTMDLTFFIKEDSGLYQRVHEIHHQKLWRPSTIFTMLAAQNWSLGGYYDFATWDEPEGEATRWQFVAIKE